MKYSEITWTNAFGKRRKMVNLSKQHLSNIYWYIRVFFHEYPIESKTIEMVKYILDYKFDGKILPWKPLPIPNEVANIKSGRYCTVNDKGDIIYNNEVIGTLKHISGWETI